MTPASAFKFVTLNSLLLLVSFFQYFMCIQNNFFLTFLSFFLKNIFLLNTLKYTIEKFKKRNNMPTLYPKENYPHEFLFNIIMVSCLEYLGYQTIISNASFIDFSSYQILYFIPISFIFEIIFDFFHYWSHRGSHMNKTFYKMIHKYHHKNIKLFPEVTFMQNPFDFILTNCIPNMLTVYVLNTIGIPISIPIYIHILTYKNYLEIAGHSGIDNTRSSCFPQFVWLPRIFGIELYSKNHHKHHTHLNVNFSKRFSIWDKLFLTWSPE